MSTVAKTKKPSDHPSYKIMIMKAIMELNDRKGVSCRRVLKYICTNYKVNANASSQVKRSVKRLLKNGELVQTKGTGAAGSFKLPASTAQDKKKTEKRKAKATTIPKPSKAAPKVKKAVAKAKPTQVKKAKTTPKKKTVKKAAAAKKVTKKPAIKVQKKAATKVAKKVKTPRKKSSPKKKVAKKGAAKKSGKK